MDKIGADFLYSVKTIHDRLQANAHPIQLPIGAEDEFSAIIDLVEMNAVFYSNDLGTDIEVRSRKLLANEYESLVSTIL
jgi:elongation factor G